MPLIARVMDRGRDRTSRELDRIAVTDRSRQLHRTARRHLGGARHRARGRQAGVGVSTLAAYAAPHIAADDRSTVAVAIDARHDHVYLAGVRPRRPHAGRAAHCLRSRDAVRGGARRDRRASSARPPQLRRRRLAGGRAASAARRRARRARHRLGRATRRRSAARPCAAEAALSARARCPAAGRREARRADDRLARPPVLAAPSRRLSDAGRATPPAIAALHAASFRRGWSDDEFERPAARPQRRRASRDDRARHRRLHPVADRGRRGGNPLGRGRAIAAGRGLRAACSISICAGWPVSGSARYFSKSTRATLRPAGSTRAPASARSGGVPGYYPRPDGKPRRALVLRRDLIVALAGMTRNAYERREIERRMAVSEQEPRETRRISRRNALAKGMRMTEQRRIIARVLAAPPTIPTSRSSTGAAPRSTTASRSPPSTAP